MLVFQDVVALYRNTEREQGNTEREQGTVLENRKSSLDNFKLSTTHNVQPLASVLRYLNQFFLNRLHKSSQFSHKQLVLVTAPVSTGAIFFTSYD